MTLWDVVAKSSPENRSNIESAVNYAEGKLRLIRDTFPDYTLHDDRHAKNVMQLMEDLLGPWIEELKPLEAAMLILSAYYHDMGMVYSAAELERVPSGEDFASYLQRHPAAYVRVKEAESTPPDVVIDYCRDRHATKSAENILAKSDLLVWDGTPIADELATLCVSHNETAETLRGSAFATDLLYECDLRMCAILLRLADILDFDSSRSPDAIYEHLELSAATDAHRVVSNEEWAKHLAAHGFKFPESRPPNYALIAVANPALPAVEHAIRGFLDRVDNELRDCRILLDFCAERWRTLPLPGYVDRSRVRSKGYLYGEYKFSLDRHEVLRLFMGEQLYAEPYAFVRELLQNALDACRLSAYLHDIDAGELEVGVSVWEDEAGNFWFRVDDNGMGMDRHIVEEYFLGVGRSYYGSEELRADILRKAKPHRQFLAISRFGIGVLSSFIVGDRIEVSTRRRMPDGSLAKAVRLSLDSLDNYFVTQEAPMQAAEMPARGAPGAGYREGSGTSIAVRIDPRKADVEISALLDYARSCFCFPPVRVLLNGVEMIERRHADLTTPFIDGPTTLPASILKRKDTYLETSADLLPEPPIRIQLLPLDLTQNSPTPKLRGQVVAIGVDVDDTFNLFEALPQEVRDRAPLELAQSLSACVTDMSANLDHTSYAGRTVRLKVDCATDAVKAFKLWLNSTEASAAIDSEWVQGALNSFYAHSDMDGSTTHYSLDAEYAIDLIPTYPNDINDVDVIGHNGIRVPLRRQVEYDYQAPLVLQRAGDTILVGALALSDELRPEVSVSRDLVTALPFDIWATLQLAVRRAVDAIETTDPAVHSIAAKVSRLRLMDDVLFPHLSRSDISHGALVSEWFDEQILPVDDDFISARELEEIVRDGTPVALGYWETILGGRTYGEQHEFYANLARYMLEELFELRLDLPEEDEEDESDVGVVISLVSIRKSPIPEGLSVLPPLSIVAFDDADRLTAPSLPINLAHPLGAWLANNAASLSDSVPALFSQLWRTLQDEQTASAEAAPQLNAVLDRLRRAVPPDPAIQLEAYADGGFLLTRH